MMWVFLLVGMQVILTVACIAVQVKYFADRYDMGFWDAVKYLLTGKDG